MKRNIPVVVDSLNKMVSILLHGKYRHVVINMVGEMHLDAYYYNCGYSTEQAAEILISAITRYGSQTQGPHQYYAIPFSIRNTPVVPAYSRLISEGTLPRLQSYFKNMSSRRAKKLSRSPHRVLVGCAELVQTARRNNVQHNQSYTTSCASGIIDMIVVPQHPSN